MIDLNEEFWWLAQLDMAFDGEVEVCSSEWTPFPDSPLWECVPGRLPLRELPRWADQQGLTNIHRSLRVWRSERHIIGPYLVDIDTDETQYDSHGPSADAISEAIALTVSVIQFYEEKGIDKDSQRVYFSGHKGFHVEIAHPNVDRFHFYQGDPNDSSGPWRQEKKYLEAAIGSSKFESALIDIPHNHKRLNGSINAWGSGTGRQCHRVIQIDTAHLAALTPAQLWNMSPG